MPNILNIWELNVGGQNQIIILTQNAPISIEAFRDPAGIRTQDHYIKSVMLYQLSYGIISFV